VLGDGAHNSGGRGARRPDRDGALLAGLGRKLQRRQFNGASRNEGGATNQVGSIGNQAANVDSQAFEVHRGKLDLAFNLSRGRRQLGDEALSVLGHGREAAIQRASLTPHSP